MNKKLLFISISSILTLALLIFFVVVSWDFFAGEKVSLPIIEDEEKTCSEIGGNICLSSDSCSGSWLDANDGDRCCDGVCENTGSLQINLIDQINLGDNVARPELIVTEDRMFVIYMNTLNHSFQVMIYSKDFNSKIAEKIIDLQDSKYGICTDIRVDSDGEYLYAFYEHANIATDSSYLFGKKYRLNDNFDLIAETGLVSTSVQFKLAQKGDEFLDDPMVLVTENAVFAITRYMDNLGTSGQTIYKIYKYTKDLVKIEEFDLDLSSVADGGARQASIKEAGGYYYMILPTSVGAEDITSKIDNLVPADILMVKLNNNWQIIDSKIISAEKDVTETYATGFDFDGEYFYTGYKYIPQPISTMTGMLKIYDKEFNLVIEEEVKIIVPQKDKPENLRMSIEVFDDIIYYSLNNEVFIYKKNYEDSPFGFHHGSANNYAYIQDMGAVWSREGTYIIWDWVDVERNGNFKFTNAIAPPKEGVPNSGGQVNYDALRLDTPENINIMTNVCPFRQTNVFTDSQEKDIYYNFVKKMVERYDGDDNLGCTLAAPDCYNFGDNDYPSKEIIGKFKINPIKYWQVCNQVTDICDEKNCRETYAEKYAEVQKITYQAVKEADSSASVLIAGDSGIGQYPEVFEKLNGNYIDIIDFHRFGVEDTYNPIRDFDYLKASLISTGFDLNKLRFWITETGTYSGDPMPKRNNKGFDLPYQSENQQASGLIKRYVSALSYKIEKIFWAWNIVEGFKRDCGIFDYTGLVYDGCDCNENGKYVCEKGIGYDLGQGVEKLAYYTYKLMVEKLEGSDWDNMQTIQESDGVYIYKFTKNGEPVWVVWWDYYDDAGTSKTISLDVGDISSVKITEAVPDAEDGSKIDENDYPDFFKTETKTVSDGKITITLGESPVFVEDGKN